MCKVMLAFFLVGAVVFSKESIKADSTFVPETTKVVLCDTLTVIKKNKIKVVSVFKDTTTSKLVKTDTLRSSVSDTLKPKKK